jgi:hypothetical protein
VFILFGTRRRRTTLGTVLLLCQRCKRPSAHALVKVRSWFTLFFIPVFPFSTTYATACPMCGAATKIDKAQAEQLEAVAAQQATAPVEMTPDGPMTPYASADAGAPPPHAHEVGAHVGEGRAPSGPGTTGPDPGEAPAPGWWLASDGNWYPPELHRDAT